MNAVEKAHIGGMIFAIDMIRKSVRLGISYEDAITMLAESIIEATNAKA